MEEKSFQDRQWENKEPRQYALYKGVKGDHGALRLNLKKAYQDYNKEKAEGCVFLDMAPTVGPNNYDWENQKVIMALSVTDIAKIILYLRAPGHPMFQMAKKEEDKGKLKIFHDKDAGTANKGKNITSLQLHKPKDMTNTFFHVYQKRNGSIKKASVPISPDEAVAMGTLLQTAIPLILGWD